MALYGVMFGSAPHPFMQAVKMLPKGEAHALTASEILGKMGLPDTDTNRRLLRAAISAWQRKGLFVAATHRGYFIVTSEIERGRILKHKQRLIDAQLDRCDRLANLPLAIGVTG